MMGTMDEALLRLKGEILAPDWKLNERRALELLRSLAVVETAARHRRPVLTICAMARAAVEYHSRRGGSEPPAVLDFLKQTLALLVVLLEEDEPGSARETEILDKLYGRFNRLKAQLDASRAD
jgi:hypothetical protein